MKTNNAFIAAVCDQAGEVCELIPPAPECLRVEDLSRLHANGAKAWADVPDATTWVDELRGE